MRRRWLVMFCCAVLASVTALAHQARSEEIKGLQMSCSPEGDLTVLLDGRQILKGPAAASIPRARFRECTDQPGLFGYRGAGVKVDGSLLDTDFDATNQTAVQTFAWGTVAWNYRFAPDRIDVNVTVTNRTDVVLYGISFDVLSLTLPPDTSPSRITEACFFGQTIRAEKMQSLSGPLVLPLIAGNRALVACSDDPTRPLQLAWSGPPKRPPPNEPPGGRHNDPVAQKLADQQARREGNANEPIGDPVKWTLSLQAGGDRLVWHDRYSSRPIRPGEQDTYSISLRIGNADNPLRPVQDVCRSYAKAHPMILNWPDRRPILRTFIGDWFPHHPPVDLDGSKPDDVPAPDDFRQRVLASAAQLVENLRLADAQGMLIWNVEGSTVPRIKYVGDPASVETMCPEMNAIADEYFATIRNAGFRVGVCIRPTTLIPATGEDGRLYWRHSYPPADNPVDALSRKIQYAQQRWGCTIFYIDTNNNFRLPRTEAEEQWWPKTADGRFEPYRELMNADQWEEILRRHPDVLLVPEHSYLQCYTSTAGYDQMNMGAIAGAGVTPALVHATWPDAFKCLTADYPLTKYFDKTVQAFAQGDIVMTNSPLPDGGRPLQAARDLASFQQRGQPAEVRSAKPLQLIKMATDPTQIASKRYYAAFAVLNDVAQPPSSSVIAKLMASDNWLVRKVALDAVDGPEDRALIPYLLKIAAESRGSFRLSAIDAIARIGPEAVVDVRAAACNPQSDSASSAVRILSSLPWPGMAAEVLAVLSNAEASPSARNAAIQILTRDLGERQTTVVGALLPLLSDPRLRTGAVGGLARLQDPRILPALSTALREETTRYKPNSRFISLLEDAIEQLSLDKKD